MTSSDSLLELYQRIVCRGVVQYLEQDRQKRIKRGIYTAQVVLWLMILQAPWNSKQRGATAARRGRRPAAVSLPQGTEKAHFGTDRRVLPSALEIAEAIMQTSESGDSRAATTDSESARIAAGAGAGWLFSGVGT